MLNDKITKKKAKKNKEKAKKKKQSPIFLSCTYNSEGDKFTP
jgi:hypothetical protein